MTNKPIKASDRKKIKRKQRIIIENIIPYTYIVCEGTKTEPNYIKELVSAINAKFYNFSQCKRIIVKGVGANTQSLLEYARKNVEKEHPQAQTVWLVYDKDDFPLDKFDSTQFSAESRQDTRTYKTAWSNECFELWLILHFQELDSDVGRKRCREILKEKYIKNYQKNMKNIFELLKDNIPDAIKRAKRQYESFDSSTPPSKRCPSTRMFELVEELMEYL